MPILALLYSHVTNANPANFHTFQEARAISTAITLSTSEPGKATHLTSATHMTPVCACVGFTNLPILPDVGVSRYA